jgi:serine/threonine-protein kinase RsbW
MMKELTVKGVPTQVRVACEFVANLAQEAKMSDRFIHQCELSVDEICTNIVEHGYHNDGHDKEILIRVEIFDEFWRFYIYDEAPKFNPLIQSDPDPNPTLETVKAGGWGIFFVKQFMNNISYRYEKGRNCLIMEKVVA